MEREEVELNLWNKRLKIIKLIKRIKFKLLQIIKYESRIRLNRIRVKRKKKKTKNVKEGGFYEKKESQNSLKMINTVHMASTLNRIKI